MEGCTQVALDEARRSREMDQMVAVRAARQRSHRDGATTWPYSEEETHEDLGDCSDAPRLIFFEDCLVLLLCVALAVTCSRARV